MDDPDTRPQWRKKEFFEFCVFLMLIVPSMTISFLTPDSGKETLGFPVLAISMIFRDIALTCLIVYFLWRDGEPLAGLGWKGAGLRGEVALGAALFLPILYGDSMIEKVFEWFGLPSNMSQVPQFLSAKGPLEIVLACILVAVVAVAEETIFRGYLMLRLKDLTGSMTAAVIISSAVFALGHGYEGAAGVGAVFVLGILLALIYVWRKSLVAPVALHFLIDFLPLVLLPLTKIK